MARDPFCVDSGFTRQILGPVGALKHRLLVLTRVASSACS